MPRRERLLNSFISIYRLPLTSLAPISCLGGNINEEKETSTDQGQTLFNRMKPGPCFQL